MAKRKSSSRPRRSTGRRRRGGGGFLGKSARGFALPGGVAGIAGSIGGVILAQKIPDWFGINKDGKSPYLAYAAQGAAGVAAYMLLRKYSPTVALGLGLGMMTAAGVGVYSKLQADAADKRRAAAAAAAAANPPAAANPEPLRGIGDVDAINYNSGIAGRLAGMSYGTNGYANY